MPDLEPRWEVLFAVLPSHTVFIGLGARMSSLAIYPKATDALAVRWSISIPPGHPELTGTGAEDLRQQFCFPFPSVGHHAYAQFAAEASAGPNRNRLGSVLQQPAAQNRLTMAALGRDADDLHGPHAAGVWSRRKRRKTLP